MAYWEWKWMPDALRTKLPKALERVTGKINGCSASKKEDLRNDDSAYLIHHRKSDFTRLAPLFLVRKTRKRGQKG